MLNEAPRQVSRCWTSRIVLRYMALKPYTCSSVSSFRWLRDAAGQHVRTPTREKCEIFPPPPPGVASRNLNWMSKRCIVVLPHRSRRNQGVTARAKDILINPDEMNHAPVLIAAQPTHSIICLQNEDHRPSSLVYPSPRSSVD